MADSPLPAGDRERPGGHESHDPELIVALLDDLPEADRAAGEARIEECQACAALHADLVALARATVAVPTPVRPREFTLTPAMAETLVAHASREPVPAGTRLSREMPDSRSRHASHDRLLIANLIDRSVDEAERARAEELLAACRECEQLYDDLVALSAATRAMVVPTRPREFTLTVADADRLRVRGWRRLLSAIGSPRDVLSRPLALGLTTLGIAGLLVATVPTALTGVGGSAASPAFGNAVGDTAGGAAANPEMAARVSEAPPAGFDDPAAIAAAPSDAASSGVAEAAPLPSGDPGTDRQTESDGLFVGGESSPLAGEPDSGDPYRTSLSAGGPIDRSTMILVAGLLVLAGLGLFTLRWTARRLGDG